MSVLKLLKTAMNFYRTRRFSSFLKERCSRHSVTTIVTKLGAERQGFDKAEFILILHVQTGSGFHPIAYSTASWGSSARLKRRGLEDRPLTRSNSEAKHEWYIHSTHTLILTRLDSNWNVTAHGDARKGKWRGNWRMEWVTSTLHTTLEHDA
jgi:hypothetical protein